MNTLFSALVIVAKYAASASVGGVVGHMIGIKMPTDAKPLAKASIALGTLILSSIASDMAVTYVETQIKDISDTLVQTKEAISEMKKEGDG